MFKSKKDKELLSVMAKETYELPSSYQERVKQTLEALPDHHSEKRCYRRRVIAAIPACALLLAVTTTSAGSIVGDRMKEMDKEETQRYVDTLQNLHINADLYSRELTARESERIKKLNVAYDSGTFPESELPIFETVSQAEGTDYCYIEENGTFMLPETELTDEELLQMIDFWTKRDYSLQVHSEENSDLEEEQSDVSIEPDEAIEVARGFIESFYDVDISSYDGSTELISTYYHTSFQKNDDGYWALVNVEDGQVYDAGLGISQEVWRADRVFNEEQLVESYYMAKDVLEHYLPTGCNITRSCYVYGIKDDELYNGTAQYIFDCSDGNCYAICYSFNINQIYRVYVLPNLYDIYVEDYKSERNNNSISRIVVDMDEK